MTNMAKTIQFRMDGWWYHYRKKKDSPPGLKKLQINGAAPVTFPGSSANSCRPPFPPKQKMTTKELKKRSSPASTETDLKRSKSSKSSKKDKVKEEPVPVSESESEEELSASSEAEQDSGSDNEDLEVAPKEGDVVEDGVNPKSAWMTKEQREEKKRTQKEEQKRVRVERKLAKPGYEVIQSCRAEWDVARRLDTPKEKRQEALEKLFTSFTGKFKDLILKHEGSRVVQTCVKHGSPAQRRQIAVELKGVFGEVARNKYGKHIVTKLMLYCPDQRETIMEEFSGHLVKSMKHKEASHCVEAMFADYANSQRKQRMIQEFYGPEFALFHKKDTLPLAKVIEANPDKKEPIAKSLEEHLQVLLNKGSLSLTLVHRLILEYLEVVDFAKGQEWISSISEFLPEIVHTLDGARAVTKCIAMATAKDRKAIVKSFKPFLEKICKDDRGFQTAIAIFSLIDDTVLVGKTLLGEIKANLDGLLKDKYGRKVLGYLACGANPRLLPPQTVQLLREVRDLAKATSKKDDAVRHRELRSQIIEDILAAIRISGASLVRDIESAVFLSEVIGSISEPEEQLEVFKAVFEALGEAAFQPGIKCEFVKKAIKSGSASVSSHLLSLIQEDLVSLASGEAGYMLMHMMRFPELAPKITKLQSKLKKVESPSVIALLKKINETNSSNKASS